MFHALYRYGLWQFHKEIYDIFVHFQIEIQTIYSRKFYNNLLCTAWQIKGKFYGNYFLSNAMNINIYLLIF